MGTGNRYSPLTGSYSVAMLVTLQHAGRVSKEMLTGCETFVRAAIECFCIECYWRHNNTAQRAWVCTRASCARDGLRAPRSSSSSELKHLDAQSLPDHRVGDAVAVLRCSDGVSTRRLRLLLNHRA